MTDLERDIERYLVKQCKARGWKARKLSDLGAAGFPDRSIMTAHGTIVFCEVKRPGGKLSPRQENRIQELRRNGFWVTVVWSRDDIDELLTSIEKHETAKRA